MPTSSGARIEVAQTEPLRAFAELVAHPLGRADEHVGAVRERLVFDPGLFAQLALDTVNLADGAEADRVDEHRELDLIPVASRSGGARPHTRDGVLQVAHCRRESAHGVPQHRVGATKFEAARGTVEIDDVGVAAGDLEQAVGATAEQQAGRGRGRRAERQLVRRDVLTCEIGEALVEQRPSQPRTLLEAVHAPPEGRELHSERLELLAVPAGADSGENPIAAELRREFEERPQRQRRGAKPMLTTLVPSVSRCDNVPAIASLTNGSPPASASRRGLPWLMNRWSVANTPSIPA